jgi:hypothetical protein
MRQSKPEDVATLHREGATEIAVTEIRRYAGRIERAVFACFDVETANIYRGLRDDLDFESGSDKTKLYKAKTSQTRLESETLVEHPPPDYAPGTANEGGS